MIRKILVVAALACTVSACASAPEPKPVDPAAEAEAARVAKEKRLVELVRAGGIDEKGPAQDEAMALIAALSGKDPKTDPKGFQEASLTTMLDAAKKHDTRVYRAMMSYRCRSMQSEAKANLAALLAAEESFREEAERYGTFDEVGFVPDAQRYTYEMESLDDLGFVAIARGRGDMDGDLWRISHGHTEAEALLDRCAEWR